MLSRGELEAAYARHEEVNESRAWDRFAELFAEDGEYLEPLYGWFRGRQAIHAFMVDVMSGLEAWTFPVQSLTFDENRVTVHWMNRLPGARADGSYIEFMGVSLLTYNDEGLISQQMDVYNGIEAILTVIEWRTGRVGTFLRRSLGGMWKKTRNGLKSLA